MPRLSISAAEVHPTQVRHYRPPDPSWADAALLEKVRQTLVQEDPKLNLWWNPGWKSDDPEHPGRWCVMYWLQHQGVWSVVFYHEGPTGEFRPLDPSSIAALLHRLRACQEDAKTLSDRIDRERDARLAAQHKELVEALNESFEDIRERAFGVRGVYAPGHIAKRDDRVGLRPGQLPVSDAMKIKRQLAKKRAEQNAAVEQARIRREFYAS